MKINGLHFLLTYQCTYECNHCFVWGSPRQSGVMTLEQIDMILAQAGAVDGLKEIYFEGGEPFLFYPILKKAVERAAGLGFTVGIVSNAYWSTSVEDALIWLEPFAGLIQDLSLSSDLYHADEMHSRQVQIAMEAAGQLGIPSGVIQVAQPDSSEAAAQRGQLAGGNEARLMYRGRAAVKLSGRARLHSWYTLDACPYEDLSDSGRLHVDPFGWLHLCQGITLGNLYRQPLGDLLAGYAPGDHPISGPLLAGGPAELVRRYGLPHEKGYADACHLCYSARLALRDRFPEVLGPVQMYAPEV